MRIIALLLGLPVVIGLWGLILLKFVGKQAFLGFGLTLGLVGAIGLITVSVIEIRNASINRPRRKH